MEATNCKISLCWIFAGCLFNKSLCRVGYEWCYDGELQKKYLLPSCSVLLLLWFPSTVPLLLAAN